MVELVECAHAAAQVGRPLHRALPVPRGADAELLGQPAGQALLLLRLRRRRRRDHVRAGDRAARLRRRVEWLADRFRVELEYEEGSPARRQRAGAGASGCSRCSSRRPRFYERYLWESRRGRAGARVPRRAAASARRSAASSGSGSRPGGRRSPRKARERGLHAGGARARPGSSTGAATTTSTGACSSRSPMRAGACCGFQARRLRDDDPIAAKYVNSPEGELFRKGDLLYGLDKARRAIAKQDRAVVVEGNTDVIALRQAGLRAGRRVDGHGADRAPAARALAPDAQRLYLCFDADAAGEDGDAARDGARDEARASRSASSRCRRARPGRRSGRVRRSGSAAPSPYPLLPRAARDRARIERPPGGVPPHAGVPRRASPESPERQEAWRLADDRLDLTVQLRAASRRPASGRRRGHRPSCSRRETASSATRSPACVAHPARAARGPGRARARALRRPLHRRLREHLVQPGEADAELAASAGRARRRAPRPRGSTTRRASSCSSACASAGSSASSRQPISSARRSCRRRSRASAKRCGSSRDRR